jgi:hypothetical protein
MISLKRNLPFEWPSEEGAGNVIKQQVLALLRLVNDPVLAPVYDVASYRFARLAPGVPIWSPPWTRAEETFSSRCIWSVAPETHARLPPSNTILRMT